MTQRIHFVRCDFCGKKIKQEAARCETLTVYRRGAQIVYIDLDFCNFCFYSRLAKALQRHKKPAGIQGKIEAR